MVSFASLSLLLRYREKTKIANSPVINRPIPEPTVTIGNPVFFAASGTACQTILFCVEVTVLCDVVVVVTSGVVVDRDIVVVVVER